METLFPLLTILTALILFPQMYSLLQDTTKTKIPFSLLGYGVAGFCTSAILYLIATPFINPILALTYGLSGALYTESIALFSEVLKETQAMKVGPFYDDGRPPRFYITGDKHRNFDSVEKFCKETRTRKKDVLIFLGDCGFNYFEDKRDDKLKQRVAELNITLFCLHGNKEKRPANISTYGKRSFCGGTVYYEPKYPNILFAIDGEIYNFEGKKYFVMGGAHSVDKKYCLEKGLPYWEDEMPTPALMKHAEKRLAEHNNKVYGVLTHTCPFQYLPTEMFMTTRKNAKQSNFSKFLKRFPKKTFEPDIDRSTEYWLGELEQKIRYRYWFCGHYHVDKQIDKVIMLHKEFRPLNCRQEEQ